MMDIWLCEYSPVQRAFHVDTLEDPCRSFRGTASRSVLPVLAGGSSRLKSAQCRAESAAAPVKIKGAARAAVTGHSKNYGFLPKKGGVQ